MNILQAAIYTYVVLVFVCLLIVTVGFVSRRILGIRAHEKLLRDLSSLRPKLEALPANQQGVAKELSGLVIPIDYYGWSGSARKKLQAATDAIATEANLLEEKLAAERTTRKNQSIEETQNTTQKAQTAAVKAEEAAGKADDAANRVLQLLRKAEALAGQGPAAEVHGELDASAKLAAARQAVTDALKKYTEAGGTKAEAVLDPSAISTLVTGGSLNLALDLLPEPLLSKYMALIFRVSPLTKTLFDRRLMQLRRSHKDEAEFVSEAQKYLDEMTRRVEQQGVVTQEGETFEQS
jgi:hypothetical protein